MSSSADRPSDASPLLGLPPELRNHIYEFVAVENQALPIRRPRLAYPRVLSPGTQPPALAHTCRQLRPEVLPIFYGHNIFELSVIQVYSRPDTETVLLTWLASIGSAHRAALGRVLVCGYHPHLGQGEKASLESRYRIMRHEDRTPGLADFDTQSLQWLGKADHSQEECVMAATTRQRESWGQRAVQHHHHAWAIKD